VNAAVIIVYVVQRDRGDVILNLLTEGISQPSEAPHRHTHGEILPLDIACADMLRIWIAKAHNFVAAVADGGAVALLAFRCIPEMLHKLRVIDIIREGVNDRVQVNLVSVAGKLDAIRKAARKIAD